jgi:hypothetical protein
LEADDRWRNGARAGCVRRGASGTGRDSYISRHVRAGAAEKIDAGMRAAIAE